MIASTETKPTTGEITSAQGRRDTYGVYPSCQGLAPAPPASVGLYRQMRQSPTIRVARAAAFIPIKASPWSYELAEEGGNDEWLAEIERQVDPMRARFMHDIAYAMDYGFAAWEKVWVMDGSRLTLQKLKPLRADKTKPVISKTTGAWMGVEQKDVMLGAEKSLWYAFDSEAGDLFGEPRNEIVREEYWQWRQIMERIGRLVVKVTGTIPMIRYPEGRSMDSSHAMKDNFDIGVAIMQNLSSGKGVLMPDHLAKWAEDYIERGGDPTKVKSWNIDVLETSSGHIGELMGMAKHLESLMVRGWLVPERGILEATQAGSRADSGTASSLALVIAEDLADNIVDFFNREVVDAILAYNFGPQAVGKVKVIHESLSDEKKQFMRVIIGELLKTPGNADLQQQVLDIDAMLEMSGVPTRESAADVLDDMADDKGAMAELEERLAAMPAPQMPPAPTAQPPAPQPKP